ncbi:MAG: NFACT family protein, partial [Calditrichota bacterium]
MQLHYLTLLRQVAYLHQELSGWEIVDAYSQLRNECRFVLRGPEGEEKCLQCSSHPQYPYVLLLSVPKRKQNSAPILSELLNKTVKSISILHNERLIDVDFEETDNRLVLQLFTNRTNFLVVDSEDKVLSAFKSQKKLKGSLFDPQPGNRRDPITISQDDFLNHLKYDGRSIDSTKLRDFNFLSKPIIRELLFRSGISDIDSDISANQVQSLFREMQSFLQACQSDNPVIYFNADIPERFSLTTLQSEQKLRAESFSDLNAALRLFNFRGLKYAVLGQRTRRLEQLLERRHRSLQNSLSQMVAKPRDLEKSAELKKIGELLAVQ